MIFSSIRSRTTVAIILLAVIITSISALLALLYFERKTKKEIFRGEAVAVELAASALDERLALARRTLLAVGKGISEAAVADPEKARLFLASQSALHPLFDNGLHLISTKGEIIARAPQGTVLRVEDPSFTKWCTEAVASGKPAVSDGFHSASSGGSPGILLAVPVVDPHGKVIALLAGGLDLGGSNIVTSVAAEKVGKSGYLYVMDAKGTIIVHPDRKRIMAKVGATGLEKLLARSGIAGAGYTKEDSGARALTAFRRLKGADWIMVADLPLSEAYAPIYSARKGCLVGALALIIVAALLIRAVVYRQTAPLIALTEHITGIVDRKAKQKPMPVSGNDEVATVARAFNDLLVDLEEQKRFYEDLVKCSAIPTFVIDRNHRLLAWNVACEELTGIRSIDILGTDGQMDAFYGTRMKTLADIAIDENFEELAKRYEIISESLLIPNGWHAEGWIRNLNGQDRYLLIETTPIHNRKRELVGAIECLQDITERVRMMEALKESEEKFKSIAEQVNVLLEERE